MFYFPEAIMRLPRLKISFMSPFSNGPRNMHAAKLYRRNWGRHRLEGQLKWRWDGTDRYVTGRDVKQVSEDVPVRGTGHVILWIEGRGFSC